MQKNTICLWYNNDAVEAAHFYANTFPGSSFGKVFQAPSDFPGGKAGDVLTVEFTVCGVLCIGLNGGDVFKHSAAFSFQIATDDQAETDLYWNAIIENGGTASEVSVAGANTPTLLRMSAALRMSVTTEANEKPDCVWYWKNSP